MFDSWPIWLRWVLVAPLAFVASFASNEVLRVLVVSEETTLGYWIARFSGNEKMPFLFFSAALCPYIYVRTGVTIAPSFKVQTAIILTAAYAALLGLAVGLWGSASLLFQALSIVRIVSAGVACYHVHRIDVERVKGLKKTAEEEPLLPSEVPLSPNTILLTEAALYAGLSSNGKWRRRQLALLGVHHWPPPKGWKQAIAGTHIDSADYEKFLSLKR